MEAAIEAKKQGLVRFIGVTGHGVEAPSAHLKSLEVYDFDSVLLPYNYTMMQNSFYREQTQKLFQVCKEREIAVQTIKSLARGGELGDKEKIYATWYDPLTDEASIQRAVHWVLSNEQVFLNSTGDIRILPPHILKAAHGPISKPSDDEMEALVKKEAITPLFS